MKTTKAFLGGRVGLGWSEMFKPGSKQDLDKRSVPRKVAANPGATRFLPVRFLKVNNPGWPGVAEVKGQIHMQVSKVKGWSHMQVSEVTVMDLCGPGNGTMRHY